MRKVDLSIIILSYNTKKLLQQCLKSLISDQRLVIGDRGLDNKPITGRRLPVTEIIVVDNGSTDGSVKYIKKLTNYGLRIGAILNEKNLGFARGNNQAARQAKGEFLFFLNSDTIVKKGAINLLVNYLRKHSQVSAVSPLLLNEDGSIQKDPCYLKFPSSLRVLIYYNRPLKSMAEKIAPRILYSPITYELPSEVDQLTGAALMIRKEIFEKIGGFDENFEHFFEDVDLSWRLKKKELRAFII